MEMIKILFKIPKFTQWAIGGAALAYLASPFLFWQWLVSELEKGSFPVNADSIGIPLFGFIVLWVVAFPVVIAFCFAVEIIFRSNEERN